MELQMKQTGAAFLLVTAMVMSAGVLGVASGWGGLSGSRLMEGWLLSPSCTLWLPVAWLTPRRSTSNTTLSTQGRLVWGPRTHRGQTEKRRLLYKHTWSAPCSCWRWLTMMPRALRMLSLHMGQVQCSFSQGSTHILWKTCLQRHRDTFNQMRCDHHTIITNRQDWEDSVSCLKKEFRLCVMFLIHQFKFKDDEDFGKSELDLTD